MLTIAIPTYNDYNTLDSQLLRLSSQINGLPIKLKIFDNNPFSEYDYRKFEIGNITYFKHHKNVGGDWNIFTCFLNCDTDFLWILSTNDLVKFDCIENVLNIIKSNLEVAFFHFGQQEEIKGQSVLSLLTHINYTDAFTISRCIYNMKFIKPYLNFYPNYIDSYQAQYIIVIISFLHAKGLMFMKSTYESIEIYRPSKWSKKNFIKGTFLAVKYLKDILNNEPRALKVTLLKIQDMLMWQNLVARSYQDLNRLNYTVFFIKICLISSKSKSLIFFNKNYRSFINEFLIKSYHRNKWNDYYSLDKNPFEVEY